MQEIVEVIPHHPASSKHSGWQKAISLLKSPPSIMAQKLAKAQAIRARVQFVMRETDLKKQHARLEAESQQRKAELAADIDLLKIQSEVAAAEAEVEALNLSDEISEDSHHRKTFLTLPVESSAQKTSKYVVEQSFPTARGFDAASQTHQKEPFTARVNVKQERFKEPTPVHVGEPVHNTNLRASSEIFIPRHDQRNVAPQPGPGELNTSVTSELTRFLLKKELLLSRLTNFTDRPESYAAWKASFVSIMQELQVTPNVELDLLVKWLGPESSKHALSLRASNVSNPPRGLARVWGRLDERYGSPEMVEEALRNKLDKFPKLSNKDNKKLSELSDIASEIESVKEDERYAHILGYFDSSSGVKPIVEKIPYSVQEKWSSHALKYKKRHMVPFPPFTFFAEFLREISKDRNDPSFTRENTNITSSKQTASQSNKRVNILSKKTEVAEAQIPTTNKCPVHKTNHSLNQCKGFRTKPLRERKDMIRKFGLCYECCNSDSHLAKACKEPIRCDPTALHVNETDTKRMGSSVSSTLAQGGESLNKESPTSVAANCTQVCGKGFHSKSCAKTILVNVYPEHQPEKSIRTYAVLDDQSNASLAKSELFNSLDIRSEVVPYSLSSCAGTVNTSGRRASGIIVESLDGSTRLTLPTLIECNNIPNVREEIPTPQVAENFPHLQGIRQFIPPLENGAEILLLIGRDLLEAHHVRDQRTGPISTPFAQKLALGWVIIGQACLGGVHPPDRVHVAKTHILSNGRPSTFEPCPNKFDIKENLFEPTTTRFIGENSEIGATVFERTPQDDKLGMSKEDLKFMDVMDNMSRNAKGNWVAPLPFRSNRQRLPNNRSQALKRAYTLRGSLQKNADKRDHFVTFMKRMLDNGHAERAPPLEPNEECWYLPIFGVYHPKKKTEIRVVFDSSAQFEGVSLNNVLMTGPDLTNSLLGILLRFRKDRVAITVDIEQMFYGFYVKEDQRNFLRFLWHQDNDPNKQLVEYRMCVHVFGNSPSPAIATYGLQRTARLGEETYGTDTREFVENDFYVDDGVTSLPTTDRAIDLLERTRQSLLTYGNLRLHKIASNDINVMNSFPTTDLAKNLRDLDMGVDSLPVQRMTIQGKILLRDLISNTKDWDEPLPPEHEAHWNQWKGSVGLLETLHIPRTFSNLSLRDIPNKVIHVFSDASEKAIASAAYLKTIDNADNVEWSFVLGKAKVAPLSAHTIPRLELCAAVLSVEIFETIREHLDIQPNTVKFYTDSKIVLGYIHNETRRFNVYVTNRVSKIRNSSSPEQWSFVSTEFNPADQATRPFNAKDLESSTWLKGPQQLRELQKQITESFPLIDPDHDEAVKPITTLSTIVTPNSSLGSARIERFSSWKWLVRAVANLQHICHSFQGLGCMGWHISSDCKKRWT